jgi:hypothetical protein
MLNLSPIVCPVPIRLLKVLAHGWPLGWTFSTTVGSGASPLEGRQPKGWWQDPDPAQSSCVNLP